MGRTPVVAIVGGGPAGAHCASRLAEAGARATLFEPRAAFEKACGGGLPERALRRFPFLADPRLPGRTIRRCLLVSPTGAETEFPLRDPLRVFCRADLHTFLLDRARAAGAAVEPLRVTGFRRDPADGRWTLGVSGPDAAAAARGPFDFLVGADGAAGFCRRRLAGDTPAPLPSQGLGYYLPGISEDRITLKFYAGLHGYLWVFPRPDHSSAGICAMLGRPPAARLRELMDGFLRPRYGGAVLRRAGRFAALIPAAATDAGGRPPQGDGWALIGDAAGFVDPLTREGIHYALLSAELLAEALAAGRAGDYAGLWRAAAAGELAWAARHAAGFFRPAFVDRLVRLTGASRSIARVLSDLIGGTQPYHTLKRRLLLAAPRVAIEAAGARLRSRRPPALTSGRGSRSTDR
jgi:flavin-dependent dehydrogenase